MFHNTRRRVTEFRILNIFFCLCYWTAGTECACGIFVVSTYQSVRNYSPEEYNSTYGNNQQDALYRWIYFSKSALHVSSDVFAHHQGHLTYLQYLVVFTQSAAGWCLEWTCSGGFVAYHQEHLTVFTVFGSFHPSCCRLVSRMSWN
jgi:hypothetical protein